MLLHALLVLALATQPSDPADKASLLRAKLAENIAEMDRDFHGILGVAILDLKSGEIVVAHNADQVFPIASSIKIAILAELVRQKKNLDETYTLRAEDLVGGSGVLQYLSSGATRLTLRDLATLMIIESDNTATNILIDRVGIDSVNMFLEGQGLTRSRLRRKMMDIKAAVEGRENISTPREMVRLLAGLANDEQVMQILSLPKESALRRGVPAAVRVASKSGELDGVRTDSGIVFVKDRPFAISVMTTFAIDEPAAEATIRRVADLAFRHFDRLARSSEYGRRLR